MIGVIEGDSRCFQMHYIIELTFARSPTVFEGQPGQSVPVAVLIRVCQLKSLQQIFLVFATQRMNAMHGDNLLQSLS